MHQQVYEDLCFGYFLLDMLNGNIINKWEKICSIKKCTILENSYHQNYESLQQILRNYYVSVQLLIITQLEAGN